MEVLTRGYAERLSAVESVPQHHAVPGEQSLRTALVTSKEAWKISRDRCAAATDGSRVAVGPTDLDVSIFPSRGENLMEPLIVRSNRNRCWP